MKRILFLFLICCSVMMAVAAPVVTIKGKVVDASNGAAVEYADVIISNLNDKVLASGLVNQGTFLIEEVPVQEVLLMVRMMGYETYVSDKLTLHEGETVDLGTIQLKQLAVGLQEVTVTGEKNQIVYKLDRQSISGSTSLTGAGGTAVDILANTPSVQVGVEGSVTLRGSSNYLVYVDGKPSPLDGTQALQSIPASSIQNIEIITTPSARYKTDGDVGIINITTKRLRTNGWSGLLNASAGTLGTWSLDGVINYQTGQHNIYIGGTAQEIQGKSDFTQEKMTDVMGVKITSLSDGRRISDNMTKTLKWGWQFVDGKHHNLSLDFLYGRTSFWRGGDLNYKEKRPIQSSEYYEYNSHDRYNLLKDLFQVSLDYILKINAKNQLILSNRFRYDSFSREYTESNMFDLKGNRFEGTRGYEEEHHWDCDGALTYKLDYSKTGKFEMGYQYTTYSEHGDYHINYWDRTKQEFVWQDDLATDFYYRRQIHSVYGMWNEQVGHFSFDAGVRADRVIDKTDIEKYHSKVDIKRFDVFPSGHVSYDSGKTGVWSAGYSYRTNRPGIWNLEPYITYEDYYTMKKGNPDIRPEYIHSAEFGWRKSLGGGNSVSATAFYRYRKDISEWIRRPYAPGVTLDSIANAGNQVEKGLEMNMVFKPVEPWTTTLNGSVFQYDFRSHNPLCTDQDGWSYQINWINAVQVAKNTRVQLDTHFIGPKALTQGKEKAYAYVNLAARQNLAKGKLTLSVVVNDLLHTARYHNTRQTEGLLSVTQVRPLYPNIVASISYNFNASKHKAATVGTSLFEGKDF